MPDSLPTVFLACKVFENIFSKTSTWTECIYLDHSLHLTPKKLNSAIQEKLEKIKRASFILLGFGLCGNGLSGIKAGIHTLAIPKTDDCIAIFMGSRERYTDQFNNYPGTYYLTGAWFEAGIDPLNEYDRLAEKYGPETADSLMEEIYGHYTRLLFIINNRDDIELYRPRALEIARYFKRFGIIYEEFRGDRDYINNMNIVLESQAIYPSSFILVPPGDAVRPELFK